MPINISIDPVQPSFRAPSRKYEKVVLFPTLIVSKDTEGPMIKGLQIYAAVSGKHPELLTAPSESKSLDGFEVLGWGDTTYNSNTYGDVTIVPVTSKDGDTLQVDMTQIKPRGTSSQFATAVAGKWKGQGIYPLILTGAIDSEGNVLRNEFIQSKQLLGQMTNMKMAMSNSDPTSDVQLCNVDEASSITCRNAVDSTSFEVRNKNYGPSVEYFCADMSAVLALLTKMDDRMTAMEKRLPGPVQSNVSPPYVPQVAPRRSTPIPPTGWAPVTNWLHEADIAQNGAVLPRMTQFARNDPTGRKFINILENSVPSRSIGPMNADNQDAKVKRLVESIKSMGIDVDASWVIANGYRGPSADQMTQIARGTMPAPVQISRIVTPVKVTSEIVEKATKAARNALAPIVFQSHPESIDYMTTLMAQNGGKGPSQDQMKEFRSRFTPSKEPIVNTAKSMRIRPRLTVSNLNAFTTTNHGMPPQNIAEEDDDEEFGDYFSARHTGYEEPANPFGTINNSDQTI